MLPKKTIVAIIVVAVPLVIAGFALLGIWIDQCVLGNGDSVNVRVDNVTLLSAPTDNVFLGWESLFGKPADEISVHLSSGLCRASNEPKEIKQGQTITFGSSLSINTFFTHGVDFWLQEDDGGFEGKDDYSETLTIPKERIARIRSMLDDDFSDFVQFDYTATVKGANIFQENSFLGFIAENLCINAVDFISGPWTGIGKKLITTAAGSKFKRLPLMRSGEIARLYKTLGNAYKNKQLTKQVFFKAVMTYQFRAGVKASLQKPAQRKATELVKKWALNQTELDEQVQGAIQEAIEAGIYKVAGDPGLELYADVNAALAKWGSFVEKLSDAVEFCLSEVLPPSKDALYHVYLTVTR